jgi:hypothetical protein
MLRGSANYSTPAQQVADPEPGDWRTTGEHRHRYRRALSRQPERTLLLPDCRGLLHRINGLEVYIPNQEASTGADILVTN